MNESVNQSLNVFGVPELLEMLATEGLAVSWHLGTGENGVQVVIAVAANTAETYEGRGATLAEALRAVYAAHLAAAPVSAPAAPAAVPVAEPTEAPEAVAAE